MEPNKDDAANDANDFVDFAEASPFDNPEADLPSPLVNTEGDGKQPSVEQTSEQNGGKQLEPPSEDDRDARSVFVKNVHYSADKKEIEDHFKDCGDIKMITIMSNKMTH